MSIIRPGALAPVPDHGRGGRTPVSAAQVCGISVFPVLGAVLAATGMPVREVFVLLAGCGAIGAAVYAVGVGGRQLLQALTAALNAAAGK
ncbi:hypothetical protein BFF78_00150 [Streptomyces fodineus]|uniref:Uncharacterized protein n=1 Tax=Streptomyces fodineus TaxID=1904616 RepID=A0A1D7Y2E4_9ACTN|nr:hypothetical protein [Streptomyces fodineus]AOR29715.1 hypothetical protein BFF78_00150 [Streptomyces fodineus]